VAILDTIVIVGLMLQNPSAIEPQGAPSTPAPPRDPSLERIRAGLAQPARIPTPPSTPPSGTSPSGRPLFQVHIDVDTMPPWDWLGTKMPVPTYVRPSYTLTHHEFMLGVTPEMFRGVAVHPYGVPVFSVGRAIGEAVRGPLRRRKEAKARREVDEARKAFEAAAKKCDNATGCSP
jgi:hypothetical protein